MKELQSRIGIRCAWVKQGTRGQESGGRDQGRFGIGDPPVKNDTTRSNQAAKEEAKVAQINHPEMQLFSESDNCSVDLWMLK